ncbi:DUF3613 domain-containing protein [Achromobacter mucicolens]|uniref:DUF3613 domain-containing protein n=1 Tax=Achromobacter mucicolens TaxID=1389922 RepID=UPI0024489706|nr:DUF3613 domain-containing protein [Achromobacter mucicolens]MDH0094061.1 DUF3613 domain-containing protein [Achromobacter mucicolens]
MTRPIPPAVFVLASACAALAPFAAHAQANAPLTGSMSAVPASASAAMASTSTMPDRPVVQQVQTPLPPAVTPSTASSASAATAESSTPARQEAFGDVTRGLLAAQADGRRAGNALPILGPVSTAAWNRYLESFKQPIPVWFDRNVEIPNVQ